MPNYIVVGSRWIGGDKGDEDEPNNWEEDRVPARYEVCPNCQGEGKTVNPSIDAGGIPGYVFQNDPEFAENYFGGVYDVKCAECNGDRVVLVLNTEVATEEQKEQYDKWLEEKLEERPCPTCGYQYGEHNWEAHNASAHAWDDYR